MSRVARENILLIGDDDRQVQSALVQAMPNARVTAVGSYFDAIAELSASGVTDPYTAVLAAAEPIERRPEAAVRTLRQLAADGRVVLFGHPTLEPLSRKMLGFGCDDYVVTPASPGELGQLFGAPPLRIVPDGSAGGPPDAPGAPAAAPPRTSALAGLPLADLLLDSMLQHPQGGVSAAVRHIHNRVAPSLALQYLRKGAAPLPPPAGTASLVHPIRAGGEDVAAVQLIAPADEDESAARHFLAQLAHSLGKMAALEDRHSRLQRLAITDDLTGVYNGRYFRHFLGAIVDKAKALRFPVTLLLFDIDNFKKYNDRFGHGVGDEILRQTASLMRRCSRDHDLVARISGDEFAVVFWEKEGPRQPRDRDPAAPPPSRLPQTPRQIAERFRRLIASEEFTALGPTGKGVLTISGGMSVYPYDATDAQGLIDAADRALMFGAKQSGKNSIFLVGQDDDGPVGTA